MTRKELEFLEKLLLRIKPQDYHVALAIALVRKNIASYEARKGQLKESYESNYP